MNARKVQDLGGLKTALKRAAKASVDSKAQQGDAESQEKAKAQKDSDLFAKTVGRVQVLPNDGRKRLSPPKPAAAPKAAQRIEKYKLQSAISDEFDVESLLDADANLSYRQPGVGKDVVQKLQHGTWKVEAQIDLHGSSRDTARELLTEFLREALKNGMRCVRVVHGKGHGSPGGKSVLRKMVQTWLVQRQEVRAFVQARAHDGGQGALIVLLRPQPRREAAAKR